MNTHVALLIALLAGQAASYAQQPPAAPPAPVVSPTPAETLAKWPWSLATQGAAFKQDTMVIPLEPGEGMEYKYRIEKGGGMLYSWTSTGPIHYELHSVPDGSPRGYAEFFDTQDNRDRAHGVYNAAFPGIHGWWLENKTDRSVTITLTTAGFYSESQEFRKGVDVRTKRFD